MIISLTGFMGCGKSSVGRELSKLLCCPFMDLDDVIQERDGRKIKDIFAENGEAVFRQMELDALQKITVQEGTMILALGGGTLMTQGCAEIVHERTTCIYLRADIGTLINHLEGEAEGRPMLKGESLRARIQELMDLRSATYENTAHIIIDTDGKSIEAIASEIASTILN